MKTTSILLLFSFLFIFSNCKTTHNVDPVNSPNPTLKLNQITYFTIGDSSQTIQEDSLLYKYVSIILIDKSLFHKKQKRAVNYLIKDTTNIKKINGTITLPTKSNNVQFIDRPVNEETHALYTYLGQIKFLNVYLIGGLYWEDLDYKFISKTTGEEIQYFGDFPFISKDQKHIISVYANPYNTEADFGLFSIVKNKPVPIVNVGFKNWMPAPDSEMFWSSDGNFYAKILYSTEYWKEGNYNDNFRYIEISLLTNQ